jgi:hypothetical protein
MQRTADMDITDEQMTPDSEPPKPEQGVPPKQAPDTGQKRDLINPEAPEKEIPRKPIPDMDPDGQDPDENETVN